MSDLQGSAVRIFVPVAIRALFGRISPYLTAAAKRDLQPVIDLNPLVAKRIMAGELYDIGLTNPPYVLELIASGLADELSHRPFGRVPLALGRRAGINEPAITCADDLISLLHKAESICYTGEGTSGKTYLDAMASLGLSEKVAPKSHPMAAGAPAASVVAGETELAALPLTTILSNPGLTTAAIFPAAVGAHIDMSVFTSLSPRSGTAAVLDALTASELDSELAAVGVVRFSFS